jgi:hypothetical protein
MRAVGAMFVSPTLQRGEVGSPEDRQSRRDGPLFGSMERSSFFAAQSTAADRAANVEKSTRASAPEGRFG